MVRPRGHEKGYDIYKFIYIPFEGAQPRMSDTVNIWVQTRQLSFGGLTVEFYRHIHLEIKQYIDPHALMYYLAKR
jgi:hypothetical protein